MNPSSYPSYKDSSIELLDLQLTKPSSDDTYSYNNDLESSFCKNFSCCGLTLNDLHDLLQHYEEYHVQYEEDEHQESFMNEEWSNTSDSDLSQIFTNSLSQTHNDSLKRKADPLSELFFPEYPCSADDSNLSDQDLSSSHSPESLPSPLTPHLDYAHLPEMPPLKKFALSNDLNELSLGYLNSLKSFPITPEEQKLLKLSQPITRNNPNSDKPYRCTVPGCDKAYKNPNGLKYHNLHGHCTNTANGENDRSSKPYRCNFPDCGKSYKNLNGLKYHMEHAHEQIKK